MERLERLKKSIEEATGEELSWGWWLRLGWQAWRNRLLLDDYLSGLDLEEDWKRELKSRIPLKPTFFSTAMRLLFEDLGVREAFESEAMAFVAYTFDEHIDRGQGRRGMIDREISRAREEFKQGKFGYFYSEVDEVVKRVWGNEGIKTSRAYSLLERYGGFLRKKEVKKEGVRQLFYTLADVLTGEVLVGMEGIRPTKIGEFWGEIPSEGEVRAYLSVMNPGVVMVGWQHALERNPSLKVEVDEKKLKLAKVASFLVRMSDDWGDRVEDKENGSFNLLEADLGNEFWEWLGENMGSLVEELKRENDGSKVRDRLLEELERIGRDFEDEWSREVIKIAYVAIGVGTEVNDREFTK